MEVSTNRTGYFLWIHWLPAAVCAALIFWFSQQSRVPAVVGGVPDQAGHSIGYLIFSLTLVWGATSGLSKGLKGSSAVLLWVVALAYGMSDEFHQSFVSGRTPSLADLLADGVGALLGISVSWLLLRSRRL